MSGHAIGVRGGSGCVDGLEVAAHMVTRLDKQVDSAVELPMRFHPRRMVPNQILIDGFLVVRIV